MKVARAAVELDRRPRAVAIGTFDGLHAGHRRVVGEAVAVGPHPTVVTFHPHPRAALGHHVQLISSLERRLELLEEAGVEETLVVEFTPELSRLEAREFADRLLRPIGTTVVAAGADFRFGHRRGGDLDLLDALGFEVRRVPLLDGASSTSVRALVSDGAVEAAATLLGRPVEVEGRVVAGDARGGTLGFPTANLAVPPELLVPAHGIYAGAAAGRRAAVSIGLNPHYGGTERRVEAHLLDFDGDLYGRRLVVQLWSRLRDERAFATEKELVEQIQRDVEAARAAKPPA